MKYNTGKSSWEHGEPIPNDWHVLLGPCPDCGSPTFNYGGGWRCYGQYCFRSASNPAPSVGSKPQWWNKGINVVMDGNMWFAHGPDFINIQESETGWGKTPNEAAIQFLKLTNP